MFFVIDQHKVRPIVKQKFVGLDGIVPEDLGVIVSDYSVWFYSPVLTVLKVIRSTYGPVYY